MSGSVIPFNTISTFPAGKGTVAQGDLTGAVLVVGGGIAGMQASLDLADAGYKVYLVEKKPAIGGAMAALDKTFPTNDCAMCTISPRLVAIANHHNIEVMTGSDLLRLEGEAGRFTATVRRSPRYIDVDKCTACADCVAVCPVVLPDTFNSGLNERRAVYKLYPQAVPNAYAIEKKGVAPCRDACPAGQRAQGYIAMIREGRYTEALRVIKEDNPFPGICGRICNHRCETVCNRGQVDEPVAIAALKRFVTDQVYAQPYEPSPPPEQRFEERVAVIGAGPCGLTAARDLALAGYGVTVFEALPVAGGMLRVGVPEYRLPTAIVNREVQEILDLGVELRLNTRVENLDELFNQGFKAILIAVGAHKGKRLPIRGADHPAVLTAVHFLRDVRLGHGLDVKDQHVLVMGGGNVALDCARTAVRLGASQVDVVCLESLESMPADEEEVRNGLEEGIAVYPSHSCIQVVHSPERVLGIEVVDVTFMQFETDGSLTLETLPDSEHYLACDLLIFAIGQDAGLAFIPEDSEVGVTRRGAVAANPNTMATSRQGVFAAGDATTGTSFVIEAVAAGRKAAENIHKYLQGKNLESREHVELPVVKMSPTRLNARIAKGEITVQPRIRQASLEAGSRRDSFQEVSLGYSEAEARAEAARCLQCGLCSECLACVYACRAGAIRHDEAPSIEKLAVGAVIMASGFEAYDARLSGEYGLGRYPDVVTSLQLERILSPSGPFSGRLVRPSDSHKPQRIAWIQCVGSRQADRNWCSAVCCMVATKQAIMAKEHNPGTDCTVFYIDFRAYGKGFDAYYQRAQEAGVRFIRALPAAVRQEAGALTLAYCLPDGQLLSESFDMVVLSVGLQPPREMVGLARSLNLGLNGHGFVRTNQLAPLDTTRPGVYACGPLVEPRDIPETVISASAAAARAMSLLAPARHSQTRRKEYPPERDLSSQPPRIGVFVCHCGTNIAGVVDVAAVTAYARSLPDVVYADHNLFSCSSDSQARIRQAVAEHDLNRVVVASCTPRTHERLFQGCVREAGLNSYLFELANIRDQCSWVHRDQPQAATQKARDLVRMAVAKIRLAQPLQRKELAFNHDALVIGGGLAGMTAALELARQGFEVSLVEREHQLGGNMRHLRFLLDHREPQTLLHEIRQQVMNHPCIHLFLNAQLVSFEGSLGKFTSTLQLAHNDAQPVIHHGVVVLATGARAYQPTEYLYGQDERVVTQLEMETELAQRPGKLVTLEAVAMIQCVGSRNEERPYCSRLCCGQAVKNALEMKKRSPRTEVYVLYRDMRTYGLLEEHYRAARQAGVIFLRFEADRPPTVTAGDRLHVGLHDPMLNSEITLTVDRLILSVATVPHDDAAQVAQLLKVPRTADGFYQEAHMKLSPVDFASEGIYLAGMAHYPKKALTESVVQATAAAGRAATVLAKPAIEIEPMIAHVVEARCDGCAYCVDPCPFNAISLVEYEDENGRVKKRVFIDESICKGCGTCQATCPKDAVFVSHFTLQQLRAMTMAALER
jgi:heterodisulfide reductase subunit A-like polyferredoxin